MRAVGIVTGEVEDDGCVLQGRHKSEPVDASLLNKTEKTSIARRVASARWTKEGA